MASTSCSARKRKLKSQEANPDTSTKRSDQKDHAVNRTSLPVMKQSSCTSLTSKDLLYLTIYWLTLVILEVFENFLDRVYNKYGAGEGLKTVDLKEKVARSYNMDTDIGCVQDHMPVTVSFSSREISKEPRTYIPIKYERDTAYILASVVPNEYKHFWKSMKREEKTQLYLLLTIDLIALHDKVAYDNIVDKWVRRKENEPRQCRESFFHLAYYGEDDGSNTEMAKNSIREILRDNRSPSELEDDLAKWYDNMNFMSMPLYEHLAYAFLCGMINGVGRESVAALCQRFIKIIQGCFPHYHFAMITVSSTTKEDAHSSSESSTRDDTDSDVFALNTRRRSCSSLENSSNCVLGKVTKRYVDFDIFCGGPLQTGKYLLLVKVLSHGKGMLKAQAQFVKELVSCLQGQSEIFGLLISSTMAELFRVKRFNLPLNQIKVCSQSYQFMKADILSRVNVDIQRMQTFFMDILTCLIYSVKEIATLQDIVL